LITQSNDNIVQLGKVFQDLIESHGDIEPLLILAEYLAWESNFELAWNLLSKSHQEIKDEGLKKELECALEELAKLSN